MARFQISRILDFSPKILYNNSLLLFWCPYMVINVSVQCHGGLLLDIILSTLCDSIGEPFQYHVEFLSLQPMFPPKPLD